MCYPVHIRVPVVLQNDVDQNLEIKVVKCYPWLKTSNDMFPHSTNKLCTKVIHDSAVPISRNCDTLFMESLHCLYKKIIIVLDHNCKHDTACYYLLIVFTVTQQKNKLKTIQWKKLRNWDVIEDKKK